MSYLLFKKNALHYYYIIKLRDKSKFTQFQDKITYLTETVYTLICLLSLIMTLR